MTGNVASADPDANGGADADAHVHADADADADADANSRRGARVRAGASVNPALDRFDEGFLRKLEALTMVAKRASGGDIRAERRGRRIGAGIEFADHREYAPGDDVRSLDWNLFARLDRPFVRLREEDENMTLSIAVDTSASMSSGTPAKLELALRIAAALAYVGLAGLDRVRVSLVGAGVNGALAPMRGKTSASRVLAFLAQARAAGRTDLAAALRDVQASGGRSTRRGLTVLISDLLDAGGCLPVLDRLRATGQETAIVQITTDDDATVPFDGDVLLQDAETGETRAVTITAATRRDHAARYQALLTAVATACRKRGVPYFRIASGVPFQDAVLRILRLGGVVG